MEIVDCEQNSPEWYAARRGIPTASRFASVLSKGKKDGQRVTRAAYMRRLAAEIVTGVTLDTFASADMVRGHEMEHEARDVYSFISGYDPASIGFIKNFGAGCSPDALVGERGALEIKTMRGDLLIALFEKDMFPPEHLAQCQGVMWIAEREWIDLAVYWPGMQLFLKRMYRDEKYIEKLAREVTAFNAELAALVSWAEVAGL